MTITIRFRRHHSSCRARNRTWRFTKTYANGIIAQKRAHRAVPTGRPIRMNLSGRKASKRIIVRLAKSYGVRMFWRISFHMECAGLFGPAVASLFSPRTDFLSLSILIGCQDKKVKKTSVHSSGQVSEPDRTAAPARQSTTTPRGDVRSYEPGANGGPVRRLPFLTFMLPLSRLPLSLLLLLLVVVAVGTPHVCVCVRVADRS
jgi:hypothetical protein